MAKFKIFLFALILVSCICLYYYNTKTKTLFSVESSSTTEKLSSNSYQNINFNINNKDVFSFVHIQKTGGTTIEKHLISNIKDGNCHCEKTKKPSCMCYRRDSTEIWLICRYIKPKWPCGLHPDYASLKECSTTFMNNNYGENDRRYFFGTILRDPVIRFLSEFRHRQRGANWEGSAVLCNGRQLESLNPTCYEGKIWLDVNLEKFMACPHNFAMNRQTLMLSNVSTISCNFQTLMATSSYRKRLLSIAKKTISNMAYFALVEYPRESQFIFEKTFNLKFIEPFQLWETGFAKVYIEGISNDVIQKIKKMNNLDVALYIFAKEIFFERYNYFVSKYGKPRYEEPSPSSKFALKDKKKRRLNDNIPKSKHKQLKLAEQIAKERQRRREQQQQELEDDQDHDQSDDNDDNDVDNSNILN